MTRGELGNILSAQTPSRTLYNRQSDREKEINEDWEVVFMEVDRCGVLVIYCEEPNKNNH